MYYYEVAPTQLIRPGAVAFTYHHSDRLSVGQIVVIEVGRKKMTGVILKTVPKPDYPTKPITSLIEDKPLPEALINLSLWMSEYYMTHLAAVLQTLLPRGLQKARRERETPPRKLTRNRTNIVFNKDQVAAIDGVESASPGTILLHGITGSGKTAIYIEAAKKALARGQSVLMLVPEIALTSQIVEEFSAHFDDIILTHSRQTEAERHLAWREALMSDRPRVAIGPRSALFLPLHPIGLIVIDEAHEPSFKQEQSPRYSALRAASVLAGHYDAKVILGSATPLVSDYYLAKETHRPIITLTSKAKITELPAVSLVDMTNHQQFRHHRFLSDELIKKLTETFSSGKQALIFHNRRGSASTTLCEDCGWQAACPRCFLPLTLHADKHELRCHICGFTDKVPTSCPVCSHANIIHKGIGTKLIEAELTKLFPGITIGRFDGDNDADQTVDKRYDALYKGDIQLIIGTQVIAKGLDLPHLQLVGVIQADAGLSLPDYSSAERTFELIAQVIGRVGRNEQKTSVVIQSYQPTHPAVIDGIAQDYASFYRSTITERQRASFPPFVFLLKLTCIYKTEEAAIRNAQNLARELSRTLPSGVEILGPTPAFYERQRDTFRWQIVLKAKRRSLLIDALHYLPPTHWQFELDPISLI